MSGDNLYTTTFNSPTALVVGGEGKGVKPLTKKLCDVSVAIPMHGQVNSLNASVAGGIVIAEIIRQRAIITK